MEWKPQVTCYGLGDPAQQLKRCCLSMRTGVEIVRVGVATSEGGDREATELVRSCILGKTPPRLDQQDSFLYSKPYPYIKRSV